MVIVVPADTVPGPAQWHNRGEVVLVGPATEPGRSSSREVSVMPVQTTIGKTVLRLVVGDIAEQDTDGVVTAAHWRLNQGTGTDGTIHTRGGPRIQEACRRLGGCPIGDAVITTGGDLRARYVIHAVGPVWRGGTEHEPRLLASAYRRSLEVAVQHGLRSLSFPSISTGAFVYPIRRAAPIALGTIIEFLEREQHALAEVRMVLYTRENDQAYRIFAEALEQLLAERAGNGASEPGAPAEGDSAGPGLR
jgi:O-acetyl-ADP-ribose deacetylase (regulator of RNase III)